MDHRPVCRRIFLPTDGLFSSFLSSMVGQNVAIDLDQLEEGEDFQPSDGKRDLKAGLYQEDGGGDPQE